MFVSDLSWSTLRNVILQKGENRDTYIESKIKELKIQLY